MDLKLKRRLKGLLGLMLSVAMLFGITTGSNARRYEYQFTDDGFMGTTIVCAGEMISYQLPVCGSGLEFNFEIDGERDALHSVSLSNNLGGPSKEGIIEIPGNIGDRYTIVESRNNNGSLYCATLSLTLIHDPDDEHVHNIIWTTIEEPTEYKNGKEIGLCSCGYKTAERVLSGFGSYIDRIIKEIKEAKEGDTLTFSSKIWDSFPRSVFELLNTRRDLTVYFEFPYGDKHCKVTVPKIKVLDTKEDYYGPDKMREVYEFIEIE